MTGFAAAYVVAVFAMAFAATSALTLIYAVNHFDPPEERPAGDVNPVHDQAA